MRHYYKVIRYSERLMAHRVESSDGYDSFMVDLHVDGNRELPQGRDLVGHTVSVSMMQPFMMLGVDVKLED